jgi:diguanylate cyclase (GGDEF)-like protein
MAKWSEPPTMTFSNLSIRLKLVVLLGASAAIAIFISAVMSLVLTFVSVRDESLRHLQQTSDIARDNLTATLAFRDSASAARMLGSLSTNPRILAAVIEDDGAQRFSEYVSPASDGAQTLAYLAQVSALSKSQHGQLFQQHEGVSSITWRYMFTVSPIVFDGKTIGTLTLLSDNVELKERLGTHIVMQLLISVLTLVIIVFISIRLQRVFTSPIFHIIEVIREIAQTKNYAVSVDTVQNDEFKALYTHFNDMIAEIRDRDATLSRLATTDPLTGLANRRHAMEIMQSMVSWARRKQESFGLIMFDIDHFKCVNDQHGHPVGDAVLKVVAGILSHTAREIDLVARIGGEEFLVLCDKSDLQTTDLIAERIRAAIELTTIPCGEGKSLQVTASGGVYAAVPETEILDVYLSRVDGALYRAKEAGRNRVVNWEKI